MTSASILCLIGSPYREERWASLLGDDCHLRIGNGPPVIGREAVLEELEAFMSRIEMFQGFCEAWQRREAIFVETEVQFRHPTLGSLRIPCTIIARATNGAVRDLRLHLDPTPIP